jgi:MFS family permease
MTRSRWPLRAQARVAGERSLCRTRLGTSLHSSPRIERFLLAATFTTNAGNSIQLTAASIALLRLEHSAASVGLLFAIFAIPTTVLSTTFGRIADQFDRRALCVLCDATSAAIAAGLPIWLLFGGNLKLGVYITTFLLATIGALFSPASGALSKERVAPTRLSRFNANFSMTAQAGGFLSTALGGFLVQFYGVIPLFFLNSVTFIVSMLCFTGIGNLVNSDRPRVTVDSTSSLNHVLPGRLTILAFLYGLGEPVVLVNNTLIVVLLLQVFGAKAGMLGVADSFAALGIIAGAALYKAGLFTNILSAFMGYTTCAILIAIQARFGLLPFIFLYFSCSVMFSLAQVSSRTMLLQAAPASHVGRWFGKSNAVGVILGIFAIYAVSHVADRAGVLTAYLIFGVIFGFISTVNIITLWTSTRIRSTMATSQAKTSGEQTIVSRNAGA